MATVAHTGINRLKGMLSKHGIHPHTLKKIQTIGTPSQLRLKFESAGSEKISVPVITWMLALDMH